MARAIKTINTPTPSGSNITGLLNYQGLNFQEDLEIRRGGVLMLTGLAPGGEVDVYPGIDPLQGDIRFTANQPDLEPGEVVIVEERSVHKSSLAAPFYLNQGVKPFRVRVWAERGGRRVNNPTTAVVALYDAQDTLIYSFPPNNAPNARGMFTFSVNGLTIPKNADYYLDVQITVDGVPVENNRGFVEY